MKNPSGYTSYMTPADKKNHFSDSSYLQDIIGFSKLSLGNIHFFGNLNLYVSGCQRVPTLRFLLSSDKLLSSTSMKASTLINDRSRVNPNFNCTFCYLESLARR